jgi:hypothetical protein
MTFAAVYTDMEPITPDDANQAPAHNAIYVGGAGNIVVDVLDHDDAAPVGTSNLVLVTRTLTAVPVGTILPISVYRVRATLTTATNLMALRY